MRMSLRFLAGAVVVAGTILVAAALVRAETWTLELRQQPTANPLADRTSYLYWTTSAQSFFTQMAPPGSKIRFPENDEQTNAFKRIVKKEPKYESDHPFRGIARFGSQEYAFALDAVSPPSKAKAEKADSAAKAEKPAKKAPAPKPAGYNRLYFDFNHNGDLTDDKVVKADVERNPVAAIVMPSYSRIVFPRIDLSIDAGGTPLPYSFVLTGYMFATPEYSYASISINAAVLREGDITLEGKKHHVVLIDFNSNGRFDDEIKIRENVSGPNGQVYAEQGDMLLVDPDPARAAYDSPYEVTSSSYRHYVSKLINIDGRFYDVKISPAGDKLTLTRSTAPLGNVTNPNDGFTAVIYGDGGFLKINGNKGQPVAVPEGQWKLLSYTINRTEVPKASKPAEKTKKADKAQKKQEEGGFQELAKQLQALLGGGVEAVSGPRHTYVTAQASGAYKAVKVGKGQTVEMPFGPPYKPVVTAYATVDQKGEKAAALQMSLIGSAGEVCTDLTVDGGRPPKPSFTITDPKGKVVQQGNFEYG